MLFPRRAPDPPPRAAAGEPSSPRNREESPGQLETGPKYNGVRDKPRNEPSSQGEGAQEQLGHGSGERRVMGKSDGGRGVGEGLVRQSVTTMQRVERVRSKG